MKWAKHVVMLVLALVTVACQSPGQRLLRYEIELDGKVVYEGMRGVSDRSTVDQMWDVLDQVPFESTTGESPTEELRGAVVVRIKHVDRLLSSAQLTSFALDRDPQRAEWKVRPNDAKRAKSAASK